MSPQYLPVPAEHETTANRCIGCAIAVHRELGPGFKEAIYHKALCLELDSRGLRFECEKPVLVQYRHWAIPGQRLDLLVCDCVVVEVKSLPRLRAIHRRQVVSYLRAADLRLGLLISFNVRLLIEGLRRIVL